MVDDREGDLVATGFEVGELAGFDRGAGDVLGAFDVHPAVQYHQRMLVGAVHGNARGAGPEAQLGAEVIGVAARPRAGSAERTDEHRGGCVIEVDLRESSMMLERGSGVPSRFGLRDPELDAVVSALPAAPLFGVGHAVAGGHQVQLTRDDHLIRTDRVDVAELAVEQPGDGLQSDVGMRADAGVVGIGHADGADVIGEAPRTDGSPGALGKRAPHRGAADHRLAAVGEWDRRWRGGGLVGHDRLLIRFGAVTTSVPEMSDEIRATITNYCERFSAADRVGWLALFADDATVEDPVGSPVRHGLEEIGAFFDESHGAPDSIELKLNAPAIIIGTEASFAFTIRVNLAGSMFTLQAIDVMTFDDTARITSQRAFVDHSTMVPET